MRMLFDTCYGCNLYQPPSIVEVYRHFVGEIRKARDKSVELPVQLINTMIIALSQNENGVGKK